MLAEVSTREISQSIQPSTFDENRNVARSGGSVARTAREDLEKRTGKKVITNKNAAQLNQIVTNMIENPTGEESSSE